MEYKLKVLSITVRWLFILCLPILLLSASLGWTVNSPWLYKYGFQKYDVSQTTGLAEVELETATAGLISYFNSDDEDITLTMEKDGEPFELFNEREVAHLRDVKGLFWLDYWVLLGTLIYALGYAGVSLLWRRDWRRLARGVVGGSGITLALTLALGLGILLGFDQLFWQFHVISFANELWQLDPAKDYLIMLFPRGFWYDAATFCALATAGIAVVLGGVGGGCLLFTRRRAVSS
jgi:integral membrane protein (TIGR01906 family)